MSGCTETKTYGTVKQKDAGRVLFLEGLARQSHLYYTVIVTLSNHAKLQQG
jgi:hypothetical protein